MKVAFTEVFFRYTLKQREAIVSLGEFASWENSADFLALIYYQKVI